VIFIRKKKPQGWKGFLVDEEPVVVFTKLLSFLLSFHEQIGANAYELSTHC